ncbi:MAG: response regulator [Hormoscilla sp.]
MSKILIVEDDTVTRLFLKREMKLAGYEVEVAKNGSQGLQIAYDIHPALILCDWIMPEMDGLEVCRQVKVSAELANCFFILLTSNNTVADRVSGLDAGADDFISKPIEQNELLARVRAGLRLHHSQQQLSETNQQLNHTLKELQATQAQLVQSEKMSSLGQMIAGIAHEINNPIAFISGNLSYISGYVKELLELIGLYQKYYHNPEVEIEEFAAELDFNFIKNDIPESLKSMQTGADRIRDIVLSLRNFARLDESEMKWVNIHEGIDNTLLILQYRLADSDRADRSPQIQVIKEYGDLPQVECYASQLNQVFFNILNNAIDALAKTKQHHVGQPPKITIVTRMLGDRDLEIKIADNGPGMTEAVKARIFDPFFTTKPVGQGKGLGLSTSYQIIVEIHGGKLHCNSQLGVGTELLVTIPIVQSKK